MVKETLIQLWMANGFVQPKTSMGLEDIGNEIFNELLWRSFFQDAKKDQYNDIVNCKMHDLMHDLACSITMNDCTIVEVDKDENAFKGITRHLSLNFGHSASSVNILNSFLSQSQPPLRTFLVRSSVIESGPPIQGLTYSNLKCLRVLDLHPVNMKTLHVSIGELKHLRYLDLSHCGRIISLPDECICNLRNLQVLKLDYCRNLQVLPENMRKMTNLRHLGIKGCDELRRMPVGMGNLSCLRTLSMFVVVPETGRGITELQGLDHLTGALKIRGLEHVRSSNDAKKANLLRKKNLRALRLYWSEENNGNIEVGEGLQPHPNIRVLGLNYYNGLKFPSWMMKIRRSCVPNLVEISLVGCRRCENLPPLGQLPLLEFLMISGMDSVKCIGGDHPPQGSSLFPSLRLLRIHNMPNLEEWYAPSSKEKENIRVFPSLKELMLEGCPKLRTLPSSSGGELPVVFPSLKELTLQGCPKLRTLFTTTFSSSIKVLQLTECNEMMLESSSLVKVIGCLQSLEIRSFNKIETLPKVLMENLPSTLTELDIDDCKELVCLPAGIMQNLTSLRSFYISGCHSLKVLPELGSRNNNTSTVMTRLWIQNCNGLTSVSDCLRHLTTLEDLMINGCPQIEFLPDDFQDLTSLRHLRISYLPKMTCLPEGLQHVAGKVESLEIFGCRGLTSLPEWMYKFTSLRKLDIYCQNLKVLPEQVLHLTS